MSLILPPGLANGVLGARRWTAWRGSPELTLFLNINPHHCVAARPGQWRAAALGVGRVTRQRGVQPKPKPKFIMYFCRQAWPTACCCARRWTA